MRTPESDDRMTIDVNIDWAELQILKNLTGLTRISFQMQTKSLKEFIEILSEADGPKFRQ